MNLMNTAAVLAAYDRHAAPHVREQMVGWVVESASGATLRGAGGLSVIDLASGGFGYGHPHVKQAVQEKIRSGPLSSRILINRTLTELVVQLADIAPGDLSVSYVCNSGEEALDSALKLAKGHWPERHKVVVAQGADHGSLSHGVYFAGLGSRYLRGLTYTPARLPFGDAQAFCAAIDDDTAAVLLEPLSLEQGDLQANRAFWTAVRKRCDETGALLIVNENRTGLGRSGKVFAVEATGICPDVIVVGGALNGGFISVGAYVTRRAINDKVYGRRNPSLHGSTTGGNPACCAAALAAIEVMRNEHFAEQHHTMGLQAQTWLSAVHKRRQAPGLMKVQSAGSMTVLDFDSAQTAHRVRQLALESGALLRSPVESRLIVYPPLAITPTEHRAGLHVLIQAIKGIGDIEAAARAPLPPSQDKQAKELIHEPT